MGFKQHLFELRHMHEIAKDDGDEFLDKLLNQKVAINIKVDQVAFVVKKIGEEIEFFSKDGKQPINKIKRSINDLYEDAIAHIRSCKWQWLPDGVEIFLEHFTDKLKMTTAYKQRPRNNLIISYVKYNGTIISPDKRFIQDIATLLEVSPPPVLFVGKLDESQKKQIVNFAKMNDEQRRNTYGRDSFVDFLMSLFVHPKELKWLYEGGYEGVVFYFGDGQVVPAKLIDPMFAVDKKQEKAEGYGDYEKVLDALIFSHLPEVFDTVLQKHTASTGKEESYINFIAQLAMELIDKFGSQFDEKLKPYSSYRAGRRKLTGLTYSLLPVAIKQLSTKHWWTDDIVVQLMSLLRTKRANARQALSAHGDIAKQWKSYLDNALTQMSQRGVQGS